MRRWAWTSVVVLVITHFTAWIIFADGAGDVHYLGFALITAVAATMVPPLKWRPTHSGPMVLQSLLRSEPAIGWPEFPTHVASGAFAGAIALALPVALKDPGPHEAWATIAAISALFLIAALWNRRAPALSDLALLAPIALAFIIALQGESLGTLATAFRAELPPESPWPMHVTVLSAIELGMSVLAFWRAADGLRWRMMWIGGSALFAPVVLIILEIWWQPTGPLGAGLTAGDQRSERASDRPSAMQRGQWA